MINSLTDDPRTAELIVDAMKKFPEDDGIAASCAHVLKCFTGSVEISEDEIRGLSPAELQRRLGEGRLGSCPWRKLPGLSNALIAALERHGSSNVVAEEVCQALVNVCVDPTAKGTVDKGRVIAAVVAAMSPGGGGTASASGGAGTGGARGSGAGSAASGGSSSSDSRKKGIAQPAVSLLKIMATSAPFPPNDMGDGCCCG